LFDPARLSHSLQHLDPNRKAYRLLPVRPGRYRWGLQNIERVLTFRLYLAEEGFSVHKERKVRQHRAMVFVSECYCGQATSQHVENIRSLVPPALLQPSDLSLRQIADIKKIPCKFVEHYKPEIAKQVRDAFAIDFELFGYLTELPA
jgi:hypothetical protein